jgi:hypothetical protein
MTTEARHRASATVPTRDRAEQLLVRRSLIIRPSLGLPQRKPLHRTNHRVRAGDPRDRSPGPASRRTRETGAGGQLKN